MHYRTLGSTGIRDSVIGVGTWQFGGEWAHDFSQAEVDQILDEAAACGINFIDTAECYGDHLSERLIGDYLSRHDRSQWIVATKFGHYFHSFMRRTDDYSVDARDSSWNLPCDHSAWRPSTFTSFIRDLTMHSATTNSGRCSMSRSVPARFATWAFQFWERAV